MKAGTGRGNLAAPFNLLQGGEKIREELKVKVRVFESDNGQKIWTVDGVVVRHSHRPEVVEYNNHEGEKWEELGLEGFFQEITDPEQLEIEKDFIRDCINTRSRKNPYA